MLKRTFLATTLLTGFAFVAPAFAGDAFEIGTWLVFEDARVPHANVVGEVNGGMKVRSGASAEFNDFELAANALGVCDAACEYAMRHARSERRGGKRLYDHQIVQLKLNEMHALTEALRSFVLRTAWEMDHHVKSANPVLVMNYSSNVIQRVTRLNLEIHASTAGAIDAMLGPIGNECGGPGTHR